MPKYVNSAGLTKALSLVKAELAKKAGTSAATQSAAGLMSAADKKKLDGITAGANAYTHPTTSGNKHIPSGGSSGQILRWSADGTAVWGADNNTTYEAATQSAQGLMSAADKKKLDGIASGATAVTVDSGLSSTSTNPVQNKVINSALAGKAASNHGHGAATQSADGFLSAADKKKLDGIASGANAYTHPVTSGNKHIPAGGSAGQILRWSADGTAVWGADNNTTYNAATQSAQGLMSAADKIKLDGIGVATTAEIDEAIAAL